MHHQHMITGNSGGDGLYDPGGRVPARPPPAKYLNFERSPRGLLRSKTQTSTRLWSMWPIPMHAMVGPTHSIDMTSRCL